MKNNIILVLVLSSLLLFGCNNQKTSDENQILSVTIEPQRYFLEQLVGDKFTVKTLIPAGANPETFDPTPSQLINVSKSKFFFTLGTLNIENIIVEKIKENNPEILFENCSIGISRLHDETHHHDGDETSPHHDGDPHIWSSPNTAKVIIQNMYNSLISFDEKNKDYYKKRYDKLISIIDSTDTTIKDYLDIAPNKNFIIYHPSLSYFAEEYGLNQFVIEKDGKNPTPKQLATLIDIAKEKQIKVVFIQQEYDIKSAETIAKSIHARMVPINLLNYNWNEEMLNIAKAFSHE